MDVCGAKKHYLCFIADIWNIWWIIYGESRSNKCNMHCMPMCSKRSLATLNWIVYECTNHMEFLKIATNLHFSPSAYFNYRAHCSFPGHRTLIKCEIVSQSRFCGNGDLTLLRPRFRGDIQTLFRLLRKFGSAAFPNWMRYKHVSRF